MWHHLAVFYRSCLDDIIAGLKTIECRLGQVNLPPHGDLDAGDLIWLKQVSGPVRAVVTARSVRRFDPLTPHLLKLIRRQWGQQIRAPLSFWKGHQSANLATLIWLTDVCTFKPFTIEKRDRRAWIILESPPVPGGSFIWRRSGS